MFKLMQSVLIIALVALILSFAWLIFFSDKGLMAMELSEEKKQETVLQNQILKQQNHVLNGEIERLRSDPDYIEDVARQDLGMVAPDEVIFKP